MESEAGQVAPIERMAAQEPPETYWDAHCHLSDPRLDSSREAVIRRARDCGITRFVQGGVGPEDWQRQLRLLERYPEQILPVFGLHPWWISENGEASSKNALRDLAGLLNRAVAIGELGLDFSPRFPIALRELQQHFFREQLEIAGHHQLPLVLHVVSAHTEALELLTKSPPLHGGLIHAFTGSLQTARKYLELGFTLSIGGRITHPGSKSEALRKMIQELPLDRMVIESDAPDQSSLGFQGRLNEPVSIIEIAGVVARLKSATTPTILRQSKLNLSNLFGARQIKAQS